MPSIFPQWVQDINTVFGLLGFIITFVVMLQVAQIRKSFRSRARLPEILKELQKAGSALNTTLESWPSRKNDAREPIKVSVSLLLAATPLLPRETRYAIKRIRRKLADSASDFNSVKYSDPSEAWEIYSEIQLSITHLNQSVRNMKWD